MERSRLSDDVSSSKFGDSKISNHHCDSQNPLMKKKQAAFMAMTEMNRQLILRKNKLLNLSDHDQDRSVSQLMENNNDVESENLSSSKKQTVKRVRFKSPLTTDLFPCLQLPHSTAHNTIPTAHVKSNMKKISPVMLVRVNSRQWSNDRHDSVLTRRARNENSVSENAHRDSENHQTAFPHLKPDSFYAHTSGKCSVANMSHSRNKTETTIPRKRDFLGQIGFNAGESSESSVWAVSRREANFSEMNEETKHSKGKTLKFSRHVHDVVGEKKGVVSKKRKKEEDEEYDSTMARMRTNGEMKVVEEIVNKDSEENKGVDDEPNDELTSGKNAKQGTFGCFQNRIEELENTCVNCRNMRISIISQKNDVFQFKKKVFDRFLRSACCWRQFCFFCASEAFDLEECLHCHMSLKIADNSWIADLKGELKRALFGNYFFFSCLVLEKITHFVALNKQSKMICDKKTSRSSRLRHLSYKSFRTLLKNIGQVQKYRNKIMH
jgi:hypothetical protein